MAPLNRKGDVAAFGFAAWIFVVFTAFAGAGPGLRVATAWVIGLIVGIVA